MKIGDRVEIIRSVYTKSGYPINAGEPGYIDFIDNLSGECAVFLAGPYSDYETEVAIYVENLRLIEDPFKQ